MSANRRRSRSRSPSDARRRSRSPSAALQGRKLFIGGVSWDTTDEGFRKFFEQFGEIEDAIIMRNRETGASRGFGFVTFSERSAADKVLKDDGLELDGRRIDPKSAEPRGQPRRTDPYVAPGYAGNSHYGVYPKDETASKKLFVGALPPEATEEHLRRYFDKYGVIRDAVVMIDNETTRSRGFGFVRFEEQKSVEAVLEVKEHILCGKVVDCKRALPKGTSRSSGRGPYHSYNRGRGRMGDRMGRYDRDRYNPRAPYRGDYYGGRGGPPPPPPPPPPRVGGYDGYHDPSRYGPPSAYGDARMGYYNDYPYPDDRSYDAPPPRRGGYDYGYAAQPPPPPRNEPGNADVKDYGYAAYDHPNSANRADPNNREGGDQNRVDGGARVGREDSYSPRRR